MTAISGRWQNLHRITSKFGRKVVDLCWALILMSIYGRNLFGHLQKFDQKSTSKFCLRIRHFFRLKFNQISTSIARSKIGQFMFPLSRSNFDISLWSKLTEFCETISQGGQLVTFPPSSHLWSLFSENGHWSHLSH